MEKTANNVGNDGYLQMIGVQSPCWLMISSGMTNYPSYIGDSFIIQEREIPINQPGPNGMIEGFWTLLKLKQDDLPLPGQITTKVYWIYLGAISKQKSAGTRAEPSAST